jgi:hypothetical protein
VKDWGEEEEESERRSSEKEDIMKGWSLSIEESRI